MRKPRRLETPAGVDVEASGSGGPRRVLPALISVDLAVLATLPIASARPVTLPMVGAASAAVLVALLFDSVKVKSQLVKASERLSVALRRADDLERAQRILWDNMVNGITLHSPHGELVASNAAATRLLGLTADQLAGSSSRGPGWKAVRADGQAWAPGVTQGVDAVHSDIGPQDEVVRVSTDAGLVRWLRANTVIVRGATGSPEGVITTYADITGSHVDQVPLLHKQQESRHRVQRALQGEDSLRVVYQPIVDLLNGDVVGYEALSRFSLSPLRPPDQWFSEAAAVGLGVELELHALRAALAGRSRVPPETYLSLNVSPQTVMSPLLCDLLAAFPCEGIVLEVTDHVGVDDSDALAGSLGRLRSWGLRIAIDDSGHGYASLRHILNIRPDIIKLDMALTRGIDSDPARQALAIALVSLRQDIDAVLVAEGIETRTELEELVRLGLRHGQGYYLGRPAALPQREPVPSAKAEFGPLAAL